MKNLLITGGLGYIGSKFIEKYSKFYNIYILDTGLYGNKNEEKFHFIKKDLRNIELKDLENINFVVHMAELSNDPLGELNPDLTTKINQLATKKLLDLCNKSSVSKLIYMSSCSVYGKNENLVNENSDLLPLTSYSKSKVANENYIMNSDFDFEIIIFRNATVYGYAKNLRLDLVINELTYDALTKKEINLLSDGTPERPFIHVSDLTNIIDLVLKSNKNLHQKIFNIGNNELNYSIRTVAEKIKDILGIKKISFGMKDEDQRSYLVDFSKIKNEFTEFNIEYNLEKGIKDLILNFENHKFDSNSKRIKKINNLIEDELLSDDLYWIK